MKKTFALTLFLMASAAQAQQAIPPAMSTCESMIKNAVQQESGWQGTPIQYSTDGVAGWRGEGAGFQPLVAGARRMSVTAIDGTYAMWVRDGVGYVYTVYDNPGAGDLTWFECKANPATGAVTGIVERVLPGTKKS